MYLKFRTLIITSLFKFLKGKNVAYDLLQYFINMNPIFSAVTKLTLICKKTKDKKDNFKCQIKEERSKGTVDGHAINLVGPFWLRANS